MSYVTDSNTDRRKSLQTANGELYLLPNTQQHTDRKPNRRRTMAKRTPMHRRNIDPRNPGRMSAAEWREWDRRQRVATRQYHADDADLVAFFRSRAPGSEASIRLDGPRVDEVLALDRANERAEAMARAADRSGKFDDRAMIEIIDAAADYLTW